MTDRDIIDTIGDVFARQEARFPGMLVSGRSVAGRILAALRERYAIVELPGPDSDRYGGEEPADRPAWLYDIGLYEVSMWHTGEVQVGYNGEPGEPLAVNEARQLAVALLAAADAAEREQ